MKKIFPLLFILCMVGAWASLIGRRTVTPNEYETYCTNAKTAYEKEYYLEAMNWLNQAEELPDVELSYEMKVLKRDTFLGLGEKDSYLSQCKKLIQEYPDVEENYLMVIRYYREKEDNRKLYELLPGYLAKFPENAELTALNEELDKKYTLFETGYYDVRYATPYLVDVQAHEFVDTDDGRVVERKLCRGDRSDVFDRGYRSIEVAQDGSCCFVCTQDGKWKLVDASDHLLARNEEVAFEQIGRLSKENIAKALIDGKYHFINREMKVSELAWDDAGTFCDGVNAVSKDGKWALVTTESWTEVAEYPYTDVARNSQDVCNVEGFCVVADATGYQIVDAKEWQPVSENRYEELKAFECLQPTAYRSGEKWGFVNNQGEIYIEACYEDAKPFQNGYAAVKQNGLWGYIDKNGSMIVEPQFQDALNVMQDGIAYVQDEFGYWDSIRIARLYYGSRG